jgi:hypothetical protein
MALDFLLYFLSLSTFLSSETKIFKGSQLRTPMVLHQGIGLVIHFLPLKSIFLSVCWVYAFWVEILNLEPRANSTTVELKFFFNDDLCFTDQDLRLRSYYVHHSGWKRDNQVWIQRKETCPQISASWAKRSTEFEFVLTCPSPHWLWGSLI